MEYGNKRSLRDKKVKKWRCIFVAAKPSELQMQQHSEITDTRTTITVNVVVRDGKIRELTNPRLLHDDVAPKSTPLVRAICRRKLVLEVFSRYFKCFCQIFSVHVGTCSLLFFSVLSYNNQKFNALANSSTHSDSGT